MEAPNGGREPVVRDEYKGNPVLGLPTGRGRDGKLFYFNFGLGKAKAILEYVDEIKKFVEEGDREGRG